MRVLGRYLAGALLVTALVLGGVAVGVVRGASSTVEPSAAGPVADVILVLGAAQYDGRPSAVFSERLDHAAELYRDGLAPEIMTLGGSRTGDRYTEAEAGRMYLADAGIDAAAITAVGVGNDTLVSLRAAAQRLRTEDITSVLLVTDGYHAHRAALMASDLGLQVQVSPVTEGPSVRDGITDFYVARETLGTVFYLLTGGSSGLGPEVL
ncbi:YdcF family protein [Nakamurella sp. YIM 132087]|uniref:YdcF family protein n=1 Tax=Nakamurella alba TaxID=2665158 RepID=A0A7K1FHE6_9ACTN|nr:YdcF family protein [Nakamurella alba]